MENELAPSMKNEWGGKGGEKVLNSEFRTPNSEFFSFSVFSVPSLGNSVLKQKRGSISSLITPNSEFRTPNSISKAPSSSPA